METSAAHEVELAVQLSSAISAVGAGNVANAGAGNKFYYATMKVTSSAPDTSTVLETSPDNTTWTVADTVTGSGWGYAAMHTSAQYLRSRCVGLGTGGLPYQTVICGVPPR